MSIQPRWYALAVHPRREHTAAADLVGRHLDVFLPVTVRRRAWSDRVRRVEVPLFPGYLFVFVALDAAMRRELLRARATYDLVGRLPGDPQIAMSLNAAEVESLQILVAAERALDPVERLLPGRHVAVATGPLRGARGVVQERADGQRRLAVQLQLLGRGVRTVLSADDVLLGEDGPGQESRAL